MTREQLKKANKLKDELDSLDEFIKLSKGQYSKISIEVTGSESINGVDKTSVVKFDWNSEIGQEIANTLILYSDALELELRDI
ncbi:Uncharacterised protein [Sphingobacterium spiritivorum]|uniref:Uncharacterized protein n=1 Tax=Sphingobacterium spiritivorum TaxID=258 RepID=A0A380CGU3_SPHSI|nr:hypothetical protein [Sphingobacterium spiritivorum]SUJ19200.1 Uncharacterised protein [Sphingobacterium spiritivorum]